MLRQVVCALVAMLIVVGGVFAADATVVSYEKGKVVVKVGDKEKTIELKGVHVHTADDKEVAQKDFEKVLVKDTKVELEEKGGKIVEIKLKKK